jgi:glycosyltransferase involved in cell wall biosynthesis
MPAQSYEREHRGSQVADDDQPTPTLSVTVLNYNYARYLPQCLDSILSQTWTDFELILINDCSTDNSLEVIQPYLADPRVHLVNHTENQGYIVSLIEGARMSRGKYITVISADDYCVSDYAFESLLQSLEADSEVVFAYSAHGNYQNDGTRTWLLRPHPDSRVRSGVEEYRDLIMGNYILHSGVIIRATAYEAADGYDPSLRYACDTLMWLVLCGQGKVAYCSDELYAYRWHDSNMSDSRGSIRVGFREHVEAIKRTFAVMRRTPEISDDLFARAMRSNVRSFALGKLFGGHLSLAWYVYWCAFRMHPLLTIFQSSTIILVAHTLLGARGYEAMRSALHPRQRSAVPA